MTEPAVWEALATALEAGRPVALAVVVGSRGSSPGRAGAVMVVDGSGLVAGTVGGGAAEARVLAPVVEGLRRGELAAGVVQLTHRPGSETASGMICGGEQQVAFAAVDAEHLDDVRTVAAAVAAGDRIAWTVGAGGWALGEAAPSAEWSHTIVSGPSHEVWVVGGGHVGLALSRVLVPLDFRVVVVEERPGITTFEANTWAHRRVTLPYGALAEVVPAGERTYVAVMTAGAASDAVALDALWDHPVGYLGILGSRAKVARLLRGRGGPTDLPPHVRAPMGLPIGSHTPAEIAVSVAAELVAVRGTSPDRW